MPLFSWQQLSRSTRFLQPLHGKTIKLLTLQTVLTTSSLQQTWTRLMFLNHKSEKAVTLYD